MKEKERVQALDDEFAAVEVTVTVTATATTDEPFLFRVSRTYFCY